MDASTHRWCGHYPIPLRSRSVTSCFKEREKVEICRRLEGELADVATGVAVEAAGAGCDLNHLAEEAARFAVVYTLEDHRLFVERACFALNHLDGSARGTVSLVVGERPLVIPEGEWVFLLKREGKATTVFRRTSSHRFGQSVDAKK